MTSISIACFNNIFFTRQCIESIYKNTDDFELIIIDNASTDGTFEYIKSLMDSGKKITLIQNDKNAGFAYAHNQALEQAKGKYFLPLNNDTICLKNWLTEMLKPFSDPKIGIVGSKLLMPGSRNIQHAGVYFLDNGIPYHTNLGSPDDENTSTSKIVPAVTGACMAIKTDLFREVGGFDTAYVNGWEDIDLCYDKETQIVTQNGIKYIKDVTTDDEIMTLNDNSEIEYQKPTKLIKRKDKKLLHFKNTRLDIMCSPEQHLLVGYNRKERNQHSDIDFITAEEINKKLWNKQTRYFVKKNGGKWIGNNNQTITIGDKIIDNKTFFKFMGWYLSEGSVNHSKEDCQIIISQQKEQNKKEIFNIIESMGYEPVMYKDRIIFYDKPLRDHLIKLGKSFEKFIPQIIKNSSCELLELFLNCYVKGDGSFKKNNTGFSIVTSSKKMADDLIEIILKLGMTFSIKKVPSKYNKFKNGIYKCREVWLIQSYKTYQDRSFLVPAKEIEYNDYVYDIVVPNHRIYIIRNGKGCWSSNCLKLRKLGYNIFYQATSVLYHYEGQTEGRLNNDNENRQLFMSRWAEDIQEWGNKDYSQYLKIKEKNDLSSNTNIQS